MTFSEALEEYLECRDAIERLDNGPYLELDQRQTYVERKRDAAAIMDRLAPGEPQ